MMRPIAIRRLRALGTSSLLIAALSGTTPTHAGDLAPPAGNIRAVLQPPHTYYTADLTDPDGDSLTYSWQFTSIRCGSWQAAVTGGPETADWYHGSGVGDLANKSSPPVECDHSGGTNSGNHVGTFWVRVLDGTGEQVFCKFEGPAGPIGATVQGPACETKRYDLAASGDGPPAVDVGIKAKFNFTITNKGPHPAEEAQLSVLGGGGGDASFAVSGLMPGESVGQVHTLQFGRPGVITVNAITDQDVPHGAPNDTTDNVFPLNVEVSKAKCTQRAKLPLRAPDDDEGAIVKNKGARQVVCTGGGDDRITVGDEDVVYSKGGDDKVTCKEAFCVLELGGGNDTAKCVAACYVNGGPGKDNCPEGEGVIKENCER